MQTICFLGDVCKDVNSFSFRNDNVVERCAGGGVYFGAVCASKVSSSPVKVFTRYAAEDADFFSQAMPSVDVTALSSHGTGTSCCHNDYVTVNHRASFFESLAAPFTSDDISNMRISLATVGRPPVIHVNPLWFGMVPASFLPELARMTDFLGCDLQGFTRVIRKTGSDACADPAGSMVHQDWTEKLEYMPYLNFVKLDNQEGEYVVGLKEEHVHEIVAKVMSWMKAKEPLVHRERRVVLYTCSSGVYVHDGNETVYAPWGQWKIEGRTGRGDTCTAAFLYAYVILGKTLKEATQFAADTTTKKMQYSGPYRGY